MKVVFDESFSKSLSKIKDESINSRIESIIIDLKSINDLNDYPKVKKLSGFKTYFRIRIGDYRIGLKKIAPNKIKLIIISHRKDIYKFFP
ncbi:type II toxin-antitoxin system RelE family toxin [Marivirga sp.]|uniref:type II toxin-antitoxin system RelE family toxin n=1 Tax=Marivirga sp. TaxID=2018662 RepID=UPI003DA7153B